MALRLRKAWPVAALVLGGCGGFSAGPPSPFSQFEPSLQVLEEVYAASRINECLEIAPSGSDASAHRQCRDRIAQALMVAIDVRYAIFEQELLNTQRFSGLAATVVQLGLSAAASVASGGTTQALAAASTAVGGANEALGREILVNRTATALQSSMQARRNEVGLRIRRGLRRPPDDYPLGIALSDLLSYYRAGTLIGGTVALSEAASTQARAARQRVDETVGIRPTPVDAPVEVPPPAPVVKNTLRAVPLPTDTAARALRSMIGAASLTTDQRRTNRRLIRDAMTAEGIPPALSIADFASEPGREAERLRVLDRVRAAQAAGGN